MINASKRIIGLDYGDKNIGVSISCPEGITALGAGVIRRQSPDSFKKPILEIREIMRKYGAGKIVLGYPLNMDGTSGPRCEKTLEFKERLGRNFKSAQIILWDERRSSFAVERDLKSIGISESKISGIIDEAAAIYILQGYLDCMNKQN